MTRLFLSDGSLSTGVRHAGRKVDACGGGAGMFAADTFGVATSDLGLGACVRRLISDFVRLSAGFIGLGSRFSRLGAGVFGRTTDFGISIIAAVEVVAVLQTQRRRGRSRGRGGRRRGDKR